MTKHFKAKEYECKCGCGLYIENIALQVILESVRRHFGAPVTITSSTRCAKHNASVGGTDNSSHLTGHAADIVVKGVDSSMVYRYLDNSGYSNLLGLGRYDDFVHLDTRGTKARW